MSDLSRSYTARIWGLTAGLAVFYLCLGMALRFPVDEATVGVSGDEHHYLTMAVSLLRDGDVFVLNNYEQGDYLDFFGHTLDPSLWNLVGVKGFSGHSPGPGIVVAPGYWAAGWFGVLATMALAMASTFAMTAFTLVRVRHGAVTTGGLLLLASGFAALPLLPYSHTLYPETFMAPLMAAVTLLAVVHFQSTTATRRTIAGLGAVSIAALSLGLHPKYLAVLIAVTALFIGFDSYAAWKSSRPASLIPAVSYLAVAALWLVLFSWIHDIMWDTFHPLGWWPQIAGQRVSLDRFGIQLMDLLVGSSNGILFMVPLGLLSIVFLLDIGRRRTPGVERRLGLFVIAFAGSIIGPGAMSHAWFAGDSPLGRYASPVVPVLLLAAVLTATRHRGLSGRRAFLALAVGIGVAQSVIYSAEPGGFRPKSDGGGGILRVLAERVEGLVDVESWFWSASGASSGWVGLAAWTVIIGGVVWLLRSPPGSPHPTDTPKHPAASSPSD